MEWLEKIINRTLKKMAESELGMSSPNTNMSNEMIDTSIPTTNDWVVWKAIKSTISDKEIEELEKKIGKDFPNSFKYLLQYKYFWELRLDDQLIGLFDNLPIKRLKNLEDYILNSWDPSYLIDLGYIYFANFDDYGLLCFDANCIADDNEYPVVFFDHEDLSIPHPYADNFRNLLVSDQERSNRFAVQLSEFYRNNRST